MKQYLVTFKVVAPLILRTRNSGQNSATMPYIPGSTVLGGLAYTYLRLNQLDPEHTNEAFERLFLHNRVWFGNLYPANGSPSIPAAYPVKPLPHTARSCKRWAGFAHESKPDDQRHGVVDHLILWTLFAETEQQALELFTDKQQRSRLYCHCQQRLSPYSGYYRRQDAERQSISSLNTRLVAGAGMNRLTGTVQEEILYTMEVIAEITAQGQPQQLQGTIGVDEAVEKELLAFLKHDQFHLRVGKGKTRGLGKLELETIAPAPMRSFEDTTPESQDFKTRVKNFDRKVKELASEKALSGTYRADIGKGFYFAITCCSDLIVQNPDLRYATCLSNEHLQQIPNAQKLELLYHNASVLHIGGWNALWRLPRTVEPAIEKGSVFLFKYPDDPDDAFLHALYDLEHNGIGIRKNEGFGWVSISDDFHQEVEQR